MAKRKKLRKKARPDYYEDRTVMAVMVGGAWFLVKPGSWRVDLRGPYLHAAWRAPNGDRYSAFISKVQMVQHRP